MKKTNNITNQLDSIYEISEVLADESSYEDYWKPKLEKLAELIQQVSNLTDYLSSVNTQLDPNRVDSNQLRVYITQPVKFLNTLKTIKN